MIKLTDFIEGAFRILSPGERYYRNWHIDAITEYLQAVSDGDIKRLIINMPPRSGKTSLVSMMWPAWLMGNDPTLKILTATYHQASSNRNVGDTRYLIESEWFKNLFPQVRIAPNQPREAEYRTSDGGLHKGLLVGGAICGVGGDVLILDDPQTPINVVSKFEQDSANTWFDQSWRCRLNDNKSAMVIVTSRLHENDLTGHILENSSEKYEHLVLPAISEKRQTISCGNFSYTREKDEVLFPALLPKEVLDSLKEEMGGYSYCAQYQQNPTTEKAKLEAEAFYNSLVKKAREKNQKLRKEKQNHD